MKEHELKKKRIQNLLTLKELFKDSADVIVETYSFGESIYQHDVTFLFCNGLIDDHMLNEVIYDRFHDFFSKLKKETIEEMDIVRNLYIQGVSRIQTDEEAIESIFSGQLLAYFHKENFVFSIDISSRPQRQTEETNTEVAIKGPRDNFIEDISTNVALIRKRLRTNSLVLRNYTVGKRSKTEIMILYIKDIANPEILNEIEKRLVEIDIDGIYSGRQVHELIIKKPFAAFPTHHYTGRPDFAVNSLLVGRFVIFVDGIPYAIIVPVNFGFLLKTSEDTESVYLYNSWERILRFMALLVSIYLPGFYIALTSYHQNQIPIIFLGTIVESSKGVPFPAPLEALIMLLLFEIFREAGMRLPLAIGQTLSVVGGLIIGEAAIRAGLASPLTIVIIAISAVATYTLVNLSLHGIVSILRFCVVILVSFFGFFGFFVSVYIVLFYMAHIQTLGVPYLTVPSVMNLDPILKTFLRLPEQKYKKRAEFLKPQDDTRQSN